MECKNPLVYAEEKTMTDLYDTYIMHIKRLKTISVGGGGRNDTKRFLNLFFEDFVNLAKLHRHLLTNCTA